MDVFSKKKRSEVMAAIRSRGNKSTEMRFIEIMRGLGITGWRRKYRLKGSPDFVFRPLKVAVFIDGCFWHGCPAHCRIPKTNKKFWVEKIRRNKKRDKMVKKHLLGIGWRTIRFWEHELKDSRLASRKLSFLIRDGKGASR